MGYNYSYMDEHGINPRKHRDTYDHTILVGGGKRADGNDPIHVWPTTTQRLQGNMRTLRAALYTRCF